MLKQWLWYKLVSFLFHKLVTIPGAERDYVVDDDDAFYLFLQKQKRYWYYSSQEESGEDSESLYIGVALDTCYHLFCVLMSVILRVETFGTSNEM